MHVLLRVSPAVNDAWPNIAAESSTLPHLLEEGEEEIGCLRHTKVRPICVLEVDDISGLLRRGEGQGGAGGRGRKRRSQSFGSALTESSTANY